MRLAANFGAMRLTTQYPFEWVDLEMYNDRRLGLPLELLFECVGLRRLVRVNYFDGLCPNSVLFFGVEFELREQVVNSAVHV